MTAIKTTKFTGGSDLTPGGSSGNPNESLTQTLRDVATDLAAMKAAATSQASGILDGMIVADPTTPSAQITGAGATTWNVNIAAGDVVAGGVEKHEAAQADFAIHDTTQLVANGQSCYAWLVEKNVAGTLSTVAVKGAAAATGAQVAPSDAAIQTAVGANNAWVKIALCLINRTGDTTVTQSQQNKYRETFGSKAAAAVTLLTTAP